MTFRPETSPKDSSNDTQYSADGENRRPPQHKLVAKISTIYDPRLLCTLHHSTPPAETTATPVHNPQKSHQHKLLYNPRRTLIAKIKTISHKLHTATSPPSASELDDYDVQKRMRLMKFVCLSVLLACKIVIMLCIFLFLLRTDQKPDSRNVIVDGEFQILNRKFEYDMLDKGSSAFKELAFNLTYELNRLFRRSDVAECYQRNEILEITTNMTIKSIVVFQNCDYMNVGRIGLAFLRSLRLQHGHTFLGQHTINVQSIGFQIRGEEGIWSEWSDWKGCDSPNDFVAKRTRLCLTKDTFQETNVDRCLLIPGNKGELDTIPCRKYRIMKRQKEERDFQRALFDGTNKDELAIPISILEEDIDTDRL